MIRLHFAKRPLQWTIGERAVETIWEMFVSHSDVMTKIGTRHIGIIFSQLGMPFADQDDLLLRYEGAYLRAQKVIETLDSSSLVWIIFWGHHTCVESVDRGLIDFASFGGEVVGSLGLHEGGARLRTRDNRMIGNEQWQQAADYFLSLLDTSTKFEFTPQFE